MSVRITSIHFNNFKSLKRYVVSLQEMNVLVGANNAGKSTIISSLRILEVAMRRARSKNPEQVRLSDETRTQGHYISTEQISVALENVATDYTSDDTRIEFHLSNKNKLYLYFPSEGGCVLHWHNEGPQIRTAGGFKTHFPINVQVVPILGPLEHNELYLNEATVKESLNSHRASRHFRNYWNYFPEGWEKFCEMIKSTWPGMEIKRPELDMRDRKLTMFVSENRIDREIYWAGFGFQIWCQLLTHISRASEATLFAIDEPEIYLHPDVQRQLLSILRDLSTDVLIATHSVEIIGEADPSEILLVQKGKQAAARLKDVEGMQMALNAIGSAQNVTLTHLARTRKIVFVEGQSDFKTIRLFARCLGYDELATGNDVTPFESDGFTSWERVKSFAWGAKRTINEGIKIFAIYDRDYFCSEQILEIEAQLRKELTDVHFLTRKEMENYFLTPSVLQRAIEKQLLQKNKRQDTNIIPQRSINDYLEEITARERIDTQSQYLAKHLDFHGNSRKDRSTLNKEVMLEFEEKWRNLDTRVEMIPGKTVLKSLRELVQKDLGINLTDIQIINEYRAEEVPKDMRVLIKRLDNFRQL